VAAPTVVLRPGRDASLRRRHPWVFSGGIARTTGNPGAGDTVVVRAADGGFLAQAAYHPTAPLALRVWSFDEAEIIDAEAIRGRVVRAAAHRSNLTDQSTGLRLVFAEADGLPGVIADRYGDTVVVQIGSVGAEAVREAVFDALASLPGVQRVYERADTDTRSREGLPTRSGTVRGDDPPPTAGFHEHGLRFGADVRHGHKTGFYLDQRDSRAIVAGYAHGRRTLNLFCYSGAFSVAAGAAGASHVVSVDSSGPALAQAEHHLVDNGLPVGDLVEADCFAYLRQLRDAGERFDLIVLDPPKLANNERHVPKASRAYKDLNWLAMRLLTPGGVLATFSCSGAISADLFQKILFSAALDAGRDVEIARPLFQAPDHPVPLTFPEAWYLKGFVLVAR
jgi:23S rRNA (cytosine1962-C5)-methyltransferase